MATWQDRLRKLVFAGGMAGAGLGLWVTGCGTKPAPEAVISNVTVQPGSNDPAKPVAQNTDQPVVANFSQTFEEAVLTDVLAGSQTPPDVTLGGKNTGLLRLAVEESWPKIKLTDSSGKPNSYTFQLDTAEGPVEIALRPEIAPNHVRNIIALTHAGFYDGLQFERIVHQESEVEGEKIRLDMVIAGCPTGTGNDGFGHIGYFVRSEFQQNLKHEAGTVGFWHEEDPDSAGCRFYITLGPAPLLDGKFTAIGSVTSGLDVVRKIAAQQVQSRDMSPENELPIKPTRINKAAIVPDPLGKSLPVAQNGN